MFLALYYAQSFLKNYYGYTSIMSGYLTHDDAERAVLVGVVTHEQTQAQVDEYMEELSFLAETAGAEVIHTFLQKLDTVIAKTFIGTGKLEEIKIYITEHEISTVIFDDELSPTQLRNIERELSCKILDRTNLILDIFAQRARTSHAKVQVELAQYQYLLPRLTRMWTHLERQQGGIGTRGPGEREIETDRRIIRDKLSLLKNQLSKIDKQMSTQRQNRGEFIRVALIGYTNVGKSTIMNLISKSEVFAENKLFATLDTTVRKVVIDNLPFLLSDTVGFIRKLPTHLVESFKSTLDEVRESDLLLHVVDVSHKNFMEHIQVVSQTIQDIGGGDKPVLFVFNKIDAFQHSELQGEEQFERPYTIEELKNMYFAEQGKSVFLSAKTKENLEEFKTLLYTKIKDMHAIRYPYNNFLYERFE